VHQDRNCVQAARGEDAARRLAKQRTPHACWAGRRNACWGRRPAVVKAKGGGRFSPRTPPSDPRSLEAGWRVVGGKIAESTKCCLIAFPLTERETEAAPPRLVRHYALSGTSDRPTGALLKDRGHCSWHFARLHHTEPDGGQWGEVSNAKGRLAAGLGICPPPGRPAHGCIRGAEARP